MHSFLSLSVAWVLGSLLFGCSTARPEASNTLDSTSAVGTTIFAASPSTCNPGLGSQYLGCSAFSAAVPSDAVTAPQIPFLNQAAVERTYTFTFKCFSPEPVVATLTVAGKAQKVVSSVEGLAHNVSFMTKAGDSAAATLTIPKHEISVGQGCKLTLLTNLAIPDVGFLKSFVDYAGPYLKAFTQAYVDLRNDSTPAEAAAAAKKALVILEKRLDSLIESWTEARLEAEPNALRIAGLCQEVKDTWRVGGEVEAGGEIPALILVPGSLQPELKECLKVSGEIQNGDLRLAAGQLGQGGTVEQVLVELGKGRSALAADLTAVDAFLQGERSRLGARYEQIKSQVEAVLQNVQTWLAGA